MKNDDLAFPFVVQDISKYQVHEPGMSLRDYFAAHAPEEFLAALALKVQEAGDEETPLATIMATVAFMYADAMLAARTAPSDGKAE